MCSIYTETKEAIEDYKFGDFIKDKPTLPEDETFKMHKAKHWSFFVNMYHIELK